VAAIRSRRLLQCGMESGEAGEINRQKTRRIAHMFLLQCGSGASFVPLVAKSNFLLAQRYNDVT
jgi:hypothetical protein